MHQANPPTDQLQDPSVQSEYIHLQNRSLLLLVHRLPIEQMHVDTNKNIPRKDGILLAMKVN